MGRKSSLWGRAIKVPVLNSVTHLPPTASCKPMGHQNFSLLYVDGSFILESDFNKPIRLLSLK